MPFKTVENIIWRHKCTGEVEPKPKGGAHHIKYDKLQFVDLVFSFISDHSNATLEEIQLYIRNCHPEQEPPSISWIEQLLKSKLFHSKPITLKYASIEPHQRNSAEVIQQRFEFAIWINSLSISESQRLVFIDEHGYNLYTIKHRARSIQGERAVVLTPTTKSQTVSVSLAVSPVFGKIAIQIIPYSTTKETFQLFLNNLQQQWKSSEKIPLQIRQTDPIIVLDNLRSHYITQKQFILHYLPKYSPFLNLAEPCNRAHKQLIRKYQREHIQEIIPLLENLRWGEKTQTRIEMLRKIGHWAWNSLQDSTIHNCWHHILSCYFPDCLKKNPIKA